MAYYSNPRGELWPGTRTAHGGGVGTLGSGRGQGRENIEDRGERGEGADAGKQTPPTASS